MATKTVNYTTAQVDQIISMYKQSGNEALPEIAAAVGKSVRSVRSKLVREGVYVAAPRVTKTGAPVVRKSEIVTQIQDALGVEMLTLEKASKADLERLLAEVV